MFYNRCSNGNNTDSGDDKVQVSLKFLRKELLYDLKQFGYVEGDVTFDTDPDSHHHRHQTQDIGEKGNVDIVTRRLDSAFEDCVHFLYPIAKVDITGGEQMDDRLVNREEYNLILTVPSTFSRTTMGLLQKKIHDYMVFRALALWFSITNPSASAKYLAMSEEEAEAIKDARFTGRGGVKRPLYPF